MSVFPRLERLVADDMALRRRGFVRVRLVAIAAGAVFRRWARPTPIAEIDVSEDRDELLSAPSLSNLGR